MEEGERESVIKWLEDQFDLDQAMREAIKRKYQSFDDQVRGEFSPPDPSVIHTE